MAAFRSTQFETTIQLQILAGVRAGWIAAAAFLYAPVVPSAPVALPLLGYAVVGGAMIWTARTTRAVVIWNGVGLLADLAFPLWLLLAVGGVPGPAWAPLLAAVAPAASFAGIAGGALAILLGLALAAGGLALASGMSAVAWLAGLHAPILLPAAVAQAALVVRLLSERQAESAAVHHGGSDDGLDPRTLVESAFQTAYESLRRDGVDESGLSGAAFFGPGLDWQQVGDVGHGDGIGLIRPLPAALLDKLARSRPARLKDPAAAFERVSEPDSDNGWRSGLVVPFRVGDECFGMLAFAHTDPAAFDTADEAALAGVGRSRAGDMQLANVLERLRAERDRLQELQEEARRKLARDLHDGPVQVIAAIAMRSNYAGRQMARDPDSARAELEKVEAMARSTTKAIRHMLFTLRPLILESRGLAAALYQYADKAADTHGQSIAVEIEAEAEQRLTEEQQGLLFYIAEEAVMNAIKHAAAEHVWIRLQSQPDSVLLTVIDDGVGFNVGQVDAHYDQRGSLGLVTMRERAQLVPAELKLQSEAGSGTQIQVRVQPGARPDESAQQDSAAAAS